MEKLCSIQRLPNKHIFQIIMIEKLCWIFDSMSFRLDTVQDFLIKLGIKPCMHYFDSTHFANFEEVVHNFGRSDDDMI